VIEANCHCGAVTISVETAPIELTECNCSICRRNGTLWAYYSPKQVTVKGDTDVYEWGDRALKLHRCKTCGCVTHWSANDPTYDRMGVQARLMASKIVSAARVRKVDGASM
jgi:hypothetical protein